MYPLLIQTCCEYLQSKTLNFIYQKIASLFNNLPFVFACICFVEACLLKWKMLLED